MRAFDWSFRLDLNISFPKKLIISIKQLIADEQPLIKRQWMLCRNVNVNKTSAIKQVVYACFLFPRFLSLSLSLSLSAPKYAFNSFAFRCGTFVVRRVTESAPFFFFVYIIRICDRSISLCNERLARLLHNSELFDAETYARARARGLWAPKLTITKVLEE